MTMTTSRLFLITGVSSGFGRALAQQALQAGTDVQGFARGLQRAGYATDPRYAAKIAAIAGGPTIERAVSAVADAGSRLGQTFASTATAALGITRR